MASGRIGGMFDSGARDQRCRFPTCNAPATDCDLDHLVPFPKGKTEPENMQPLCRRHHRLKTHTTWRVEKLDDTTVLWISRTGHSYLDPLEDQTPPPPPEDDPPF